MKIAYFTDNYLPQASGVATSVDYFARALKQAGHTVYIFAPKVEGAKKNEDNVFRFPSIRVVPSLPDGARLPLPNKNILKMVNVDFDIIHSHGNGAFSLIGLGIAKTRKVPYIATFHIQVGNFAHYFFKGKILRPKMMDKLFLKQFAQLCDGVISPSLKMKNQLINAGVNKEIALIPNFVDLDTFKQGKKGFLHKKCKIPASSHILLSCGRIGKEKNFAFLVKSFSLIYKDYSGAHLVIVGPDWGETKKLKKLSKLLKINSNVHFIGEIKPSDMPKVYADASIFTFASKSEVHPMVAIEAAASSLPLVVLEDEAYKGIVVDGKNGYTAQDEKSFADSVLKLLKNPKKMSWFGKKSSQMMEKNFGADLLVKRLVKFYKCFL